MQDPPPGIWKISLPYSNQGADYIPDTTASPHQIKKTIYTSEIVCYSEPQLWIAVEQTKPSPRK